MFTAKTSATLGTAILAAMLLLGCTPAEEVKTADWYLANIPEMKKMVTKCKNNPGELATTPNCINAMAASEKKSSQDFVKGMTAPRIKYE